MKNRKARVRGRWGDRRRSEVSRREKRQALRKSEIRLQSKDVQETGQGPSLTSVTSASRREMGGERNPSLSCSKQTNHRSPSEQTEEQRTKRGFGPVTFLLLAGQHAILSLKIIGKK
jgi:hypothetical protein